MTVLSTIREDPPPPLIYRLIPRADAWLAKGENTTHGRFVLRHTEFPSHRDGWQARDNAFVTPPFFFHLQHLQWKTQRMCFHSACKATSVVQCFTGREERDCSRTAETRLSVTAVCSDWLSRYLNLRENLSTDPQPERKRRDPSSDVTVVFISSCALKVAHVMII